MLLDREKLQREFSFFCRSGKFSSDLFVDKNKAYTYRELVLYQFDQVLQKAYPISYSLLKGEKWERLVSNFLASYPSFTPFLWHMPKGFWICAKEQRWDKQLEIAYLLDLLEFEWIEIEVFMMQDQAHYSFVKIGDVLTDKLVINPHHTIATLSYPVFSEIPIVPDHVLGCYPLICYRSPDDLCVYFMSITPFYRDAFTYLYTQSCSAHEAFETVARIYNFQLDNVHWEKTKRFLLDLIEKKIIYGFRTKEEI